MKRQDLLESLLLKPVSSPCVSMYVNVDARERSISDIQTVVTSLITAKKKELKIKRYEKADLKDISEAFEVIKNYFINEFDRRGAKTITLFVLNGEIIEALKLPIKLEDSVVTDSKFYIQPAVAVLEVLPRWVLIALNRARYSIGEYLDGKLLSYETFKSEVPARVKKGGWFSLEEKRIRRHTDEHVRWHIKEALKKAKAVFKENKFEGLLIGTHQEEEETIKEMLPQKMKEKLVGFVRLEPGVAEEQVLDILNSAFEEYRKNWERGKIEDMKEAFSSAGKAVAGLPSVLRAANLFAIEELILQMGLKKEGFVCEKDVYLKDIAGYCEICGKKLAEVEDVIGRLQAKVISDGGMVTTLFFAEPGIENDSIGAFLRFHI